MKLFNWLNSFRKPKYDLTFVDVMGESWVHNPPVRAKDLKPLRDYQTEKYNEYKFVHCPGMFDYSKLGYIIPAWIPINIKANKGGTVVFVGLKGEDSLSKTPNAYFTPRPMDYKIADGTMTPKNVNSDVTICGSPWKVRGAPGVSLIVTAPYFHNKIFVDDLFVYPGVVDYDGFHTINFVFSVRSECEITINQGDPLIHVIPVYSDRECNASYKPANEIEKVALTSAKNFYDKNFYRRYYYNKKKFSIEAEVDAKKYGGVKIGK